MSSTTRAIVQTGPRALELRELPVPDVDADSAILRVAIADLDVALAA